MKFSYSNYFLTSEKLLNLSPHLLILLIFFMSLSQLSAQNILWEENYGGSNEDRALSMIETSNGNFVVAGSSFSDDGDVGVNQGEKDYWVLKLNQDGAIIWKKNYGGSDYDIIGSVIETSDGGFAICGASASDDGDIDENQGSYDYWILKLNANGNIEWEQNYGGSGYEFPNSIIETSDGGLAVAGESKSDDGDVGGNLGFNDYWIIKLDNNGSLLWEENYGGSNFDIPYTIVEATDGGLIVSGYSNSDDGDITENKGNDDYWIIKLNANGILEWQVSYGGSNFDQPTSMIETSDGGIALTGFSNSNDGDVGGNEGLYDYWIIKLDANGSLQWEENYGGSDSDSPQSIIETTDGGLAVVGGSPSDDGDVGGNYGQKDYWVLKLDANGGIEWEKNFGGNDGEQGNSIIETADGNLAIAGSSYSDSGDVGGNQGLIDFWILKIENQSLGTSRNIVEDPLSELSLYPNPTSENITVELTESIDSMTITIHDIRGRKLSQQIIENTSLFQLELIGAKGIYLVEFEDTKGNQTVRKVIKD